MSCETHCCATHGCKYGYDDCVVFTGKAKKEGPCPSCFGTFKEIRDTTALIVEVLRSPEQLGVYAQINTKLPLPVIVAKLELAIAAYKAEHPLPEAEPWSEQDAATLRDESWIDYW